MECGHNLQYINVYNNYIFERILASDVSFTHCMLCKCKYVSSLYTVQK